MRKLPESMDQPLALRKSSKPLRLLKKQAEPVSSNEIWLLTLSDLLMLLMIFLVFVLAVPFAQTGHSQPVAAPVEKPAVVIAESTPRATPDASGTEEVARLEKDLLEVLGNREGGKGATVEKRPHAVILTFPEQILFDSGQAQLKPFAWPTLTAVASFIADHPGLSIEVQGHTDDRPIRNARYPSNWELSADRAAQVARALVQVGVNPLKIATKGLGEYHPGVPNIDEENRLKNRRVEIQFSLPQS